MNRHGFVLLALAIIAIAGWAYSVNYNTRTALERIDTLRSEIARERETIQVLRVEWAYLNAPERLARLARRHRDRLGLVPLAPKAMQPVAAVPFAPFVPVAATAGTAPVPAAPAAPAAPRYPVPRARPAGLRF